MDKVLDLLRKLGLNQYESQTYSALARHGTAAAGKISELAGIPRPRVYDVLEKLEQQGFVLIQPGRPVTYRAREMADVVRALQQRKTDELKAHLEEVEKVASEVQESLARASKAKPSEGSIADVTWTLRGRNTIYSKLAELVENASEHVIISTTPEGLDRKSKFLAPVLKKAKDRGVKVHVLTHTRSASKDALKKFADFEVAHHENPYRFLTADDQAVLFLTAEAKNGKEKEQELAVWLNSKEFTQGFKRLLGN